MPRNGAYILGDVRAARVIIECELCQRRGDYSTERLVQRFGPDIALPDLKRELVNCPNIDEKNLTPCQAGYAKETRLSWAGR